MPDGPLHAAASATLWLERCDPTRRMLRFYALELTPDLFGGWSLKRAWGRIGAPRQTRMQWFADRQQAEKVFRRLENAKRRRRVREPRVAASWCVGGDLRSWPSEDGAVLGAEAEGMPAPRSLSVTMPRIR